jgi:Predicted flavoprotein involved in K+ transport
MSTIETDAATVIVGAGQAGLAVAYHLSRRGIPNIVLEANDRVGDGWRRRWDSLRLFTPAQYCLLPGAEPLARRGTMPTKDQVADGLEEYARLNSLAVRTGVRVLGTTRTGAGYELQTSAGSLTAGSVVVASGPNVRPRIPLAARDIDATATQLHVVDYRRPGDIAAGDLLIVGAGTSGVQIALELAATHPVWLAGTPTPHIPDAVFRLAGGAYWALISHVLTLKTPIGRRIAPKVRHGGAPLIGISMKDVEEAGVRRLPRFTGATSDAVLFGDRTSIPTPRTVIWATGYLPELGWLDPLGVELDPSGVPVTDRGVVAASPGLYFVGMPFQYGLTSGLIGGVGRDADYVAGRIAALWPNRNSGSARTPEKGRSRSAA